MDTKHIVRTTGAPAPIGPYNQAVKTGNLLFISGQIALDAQTGQLYDGGDISVETEKVMESLQAILTEAGTDFSRVVKSTIFLLTMDSFAAVNAIYGRYFEEATAPARETVAVVGLPRGARVEISMIAQVG